MTPAELTYGSICTGYDGIGLGLAMAGLPVLPLWQAESEHPGVPNVGDIKVAPWHLAPRPAIVSSGDPCQSISIAGRQAGRDDPRFLWPWVREMYQAVRPPVLFFENVQNIVSHDKGRTLAERFEHLREDGYEVRWTVLGACAVGAPHHRHRWYALAVLWTGAGPVPPARRVGGDKAICGAPRSGGRFLLPSPAARDGDGRGEGDERFWTHRREVMGRSNGMTLGAAVNLLPSPRAADGARAKGVRGPELDRAARTNTGPSLNDVPALLPTPRATDGPNGGPNQRNGRGEYDALPGLVVNLLPTPAAEHYGTNGGDRKNPAHSRAVRPGLASVSQLLPTPTASDSEGARNATAKRTADVPARNLGWTLSDVGYDFARATESLTGTWGKFAEAIALWEIITGVPAPEPTEPGAKSGGRRLAAALPEWMMGLRPGLLTDECDRAEALKAAGNGCVPHAVAAAYHLLTAPLP